MNDTDMEGVDPVTQDGQQPDANNGDQVQPTTEAVENQQSDTVSQGDQIDQNTAEYYENLQNRQRHDHEWWGAVHPYPRPGHPDREFMFARNPPISDQEFLDINAAYNNVATDNGTEPFNTLGVSMRPTTPPMERAKKQVDGLAEQGFEVTWALRDEIYEIFTRDSGLIAALQEYCRDGQGVPPAQANELLKMVDRLKALMAEEMAKHSKQLQELNDGFDDYKESTEERAKKLEDRCSEAESKLTEAKDRLQSKQNELDKIHQQGGVDPKEDSIKKINELKEENFVLSKKVERLEEEMAQGKENRDQLQSNFDDKANELCQSEEKVSRLLKEKAVLQSKIVMYQAGKSREEVEGGTEDDFDVSFEHEADLKAAQQCAERAEREREQGNLFHQHFYKTMKEKASAWQARTTTANESSQQYGSSVSNDTVELLQEVTQDWDDAVSEFQKAWPPAFGAFHGGQVEEDNVLKDVLEGSSKKLRERYEEAQRQLRNVREQEATLIEEFHKINEKTSDKETKARVLQGLIENLEKLAEERGRLSAKTESSSSRPSNSDPESPNRSTTPGNNRSSTFASSPPEDIWRLKDELSSYKDLAVQNEDDISDLENEKEKLIRVVDQLQQKNERLEDQLGEYRDMIKDLEVRKKDVIDNHAGLIDEQNILKADLKRIRDDKEELERLQKETIKKLKDVETEKTQLESKRVVGQTQLKKLQDDKDSLEKLRQDDVKRLKDLQDQKERIEAALNKAGVDTKQLDDLRKEKAQLESQHATDQDDLDKARADNKGLTAERDELQKSLERKRQETRGLQQANQQLHVDHKERQRRLERNIEALQRSHSTNEKQLKGQWVCNYQSADALIRAAGVLRQDGDRTPTADGGPDMSPMDRINYLNLSVFLRTRNYVQLALREGCNRLANMLIHDANNWAEQCADDISKMNPSVNVQIRASIYVLNGLKKAMVAKDMDEINKGARELKHGQKLLIEEAADPATFGQLIDLAESLVNWLNRLNISHDNPERIRGLQADKVSWKKNIEFVVKRRAKKLQGGVRDDPNLKASVLRRTGLHSPLTPEKWDQDIGLEEPLFNDDEDDDATP
ncbi:hypothetical protein N0V84_007907 [Fusarium piperis]|uniref:Uncharacterized protein n=1 Tax=Fusarium piperis TaxID=1435070 RepID=A0A9W8W928_9HYPO|nr:hypothetical protein N0V84_007907 [Fusarium piperis]